MLEIRGQKLTNFRLIQGKTMKKHQIPFDEMDSRFLKELTVISQNYSLSLELLASFYGDDHSMALCYSIYEHIDSLVKDLTSHIKMREGLGSIHHPEGIH